MSKIHLLDNDTINKIAAGEVIENPRSIVKELVENSIDAESDEIIIEIKNGGKSFIRITDNGNGIEKDEIEEAFKRHCTSKIQSSNDLNTLFTLGFRGEALASIAAVSQIEIISKVKNDTYGTKLVIEGGNIISREDIGCPTGTSVTITKLFNNVPARKKFLKSDISESSNINEVVTSLALSKENISFKYINNGNIAFKTPKTNNFINTISSLYGKELYNSLLEIKYNGNLINITGYTTNLNYYRGNRKLQLIFVNGRYIKHRRLNYFIEAAYNTLLPKNKYPACFIKITIDPTLVDVNVHPAKTEVRFQNEEIVLNEIKKAIYSTLYSKNIIREIRKDIKKPSDDIFESGYNTTVIEPKTEKYTNYFNEDIINENYDNIKFKEISVHTDNINIFEKSLDDIDDKKSELGVSEAESENNESYSDKSSESENIQKQYSIIENDSTDKNFKDRIPDLKIIGVVMNTYIICENIENEEMYIIDQHAAHERINYEKFLNQYNNNKILKQELLVPEVINLSYEDYYTANSNKDIFDNLGFTIENFGTNAILINDVPVIFSNSNIKDLFYTVLDSLRQLDKTNINLEINKIIKNACVKSVKAGDKLHLTEINQLIEDLKKTISPYTCPHGRPVIIKISKYELEKMFGRIQN